MPIVLPSNLAKEPIEISTKITYNQLKKALEQVAAEMNMPVQIVDDHYDVSDGGVLSFIFSGTIPCIAVYHTKHKKDYHCAIIELKEAYGSFYVYVHMGGTSKNQKDIEWGKARAYVKSDGGVGMRLPGFLARLNSIGAEEDMQDENLYYDALYKLIGKALAEAQVMTYSHPRTTSVPRPENTQKNINHTAAQQETPKKEAHKSAQAAPAPEKPIQPEPHKEPAKAESRQKLEKSIGIETMGGVFTKLISAGTYIPTSAKMTFSTAADKQTSVEINVMQGESEKACDNVSLGKYMLSGIIPAPRGIPQIEVTFSVNEYGELDLTATDKDSKQEMEIFVNNIITPEQNTNPTPKTTSKTQPEQQSQPQQKSDQQPVIPSANCCISIDKSDEEFLFWTTSNIGFFNADGVCTSAIEKGTYVPYLKYIELFIDVKNDSSASFQVIESLDSVPKENVTIGKFVLNDILGFENKKLQLELCCSINSKGIMNITAKNVSNDTYLQIAFVPEQEISNTKQPVQAEKSKVEQLKDLAELLSQGVLTQEEFDKLKKDILYK